MTVRELAEALMEMDPDLEVKMSDPVTGNLTTVKSVADNRLDVILFD